MEIQVLKVSVFRPRLKSGEFDAALFTISKSTTQPNFGHVRMFGEDSPFGYHNPEIIRLLNQAKDAIDPDERDRIYQEIMPIFAGDMPNNASFASCCCAHRSSEDQRSEQPL